MFGYFSRQHADFQGYVIVYGDKRVTSVSKEFYPDDASHPSYKWDDKVLVGVVDCSGPASWEDLNGNKIPNPHLNKFPVKTEYTPFRSSGRNV